MLDIRRQAYLLPYVSEQEYLAGLPSKASISITWKDRIASPQRRLPY